MGRVKLNYKLKPLFALDGNWTKVCNTMIFYIPDAYTFKIYVYLCYRYNNEYQYAFPSLNTIAKDTLREYVMRNEVVFQAFGDLVKVANDL